MTCITTTLIYPVSFINLSFICLREMELENNKRKKKGPSRFETGYTSFNPVPKLLTAYYISFLYSIYCQREGILNMASTSFITPFDLCKVDWLGTNAQCCTRGQNEPLAGVSPSELFPYEPTSSGVHRIIRLNDTSREYIEMSLKVLMVIELGIFWWDIYSCL
jgi:hypothetical protein